MLGNSRGGGGGGLHVHGASSAGKGSPLVAQQRAGRLEEPANAEWRPPAIRRCCTAAHSSASPSLRPLYLISELLSCQ